MAAAGSGHVANLPGMFDVALERDPEAPAAPEPERVASRESGPAEKDGTGENAGPSSRGFSEREREDDAGDTRGEKDDAPLMGRSDSRLSLIHI